MKPLMTEQEEIVFITQNPGGKPLMGRIAIADVPSQTTVSGPGDIEINTDINGYPIGVIVAMSKKSQLIEDGVKVGDIVSYYDGNKSEYYSASAGRIIKIVSDHDVFCVINSHYDENGRLVCSLSHTVIADDRSASQRHVDDMAFEKHGDLTNVDENLTQRDHVSDFLPPF